MKRFGMVGLVCIGFIAGIFFVYSCGGGGGGSSVLAEITDIQPIIDELRSIRAAIDGSGGEIESTLHFTNTITGRSSATTAPIDLSGIRKIRVVTSEGAVGIILRYDIDGLTHDDDQGNSVIYYETATEGDSLEVVIENNSDNNRTLEVVVQLLS